MSAMFCLLNCASLVERDALVQTPAEATLGTLIVNRSSVASLAFLAWDILITLHDEVDLIWHKPWGLTKCLYFVIRYLPLLTQIAILFVGTELSAQFHFTSHDCFIWQVFQGVASSIIMSCVDVVLILRVFALYHGHWIIKFTLSILFVTEIVCMIVGQILGIPEIHYDGICATLSVPKTLLVYGAGSLLFQIVLFVLTATRFAIALREGWGNIPLMELIMRDGTWAFFILFAIVIAEAGLYGLRNRAIVPMLYGWLLTTFSFAGYRVLFNLQRVFVSSLQPRATTAATTGHRFPSVLRFNVTSGQSESFETTSERPSLNGLAVPS